MFVERGGPLAKKLAEQVRSLDSSRPLTQAMPGSTSGPNQKAVFSVLDIGAYNFNLAKNYAQDHHDAPSRIMMTTVSFPADAFEQWQLVKDSPFIIGEFVWAAMAQGAKQGTQDSAAQGAMSVMAFLMPGFPWHASECGDLDLIGYRKPQSYYRDILWNGGDRVYATVRLPEPEGKKTVVVGWAVYPTLPSWNWPGQEGRGMQAEVYSGAEKVRLFLNDKLIGEMPTGREQQFKALFTVPYAPGALKAVGVRGDRAVAESVLTTAGKPARLQLTADRTVLQADGQDLSFITVEAVDADGRFQPVADQEVQFTLSGPGVIAGVGNGEGKDAAAYQGDRRKLFQGRALVVVRTSKHGGPIHLTATAPGLSEGTIDIHARAENSRPELR